MSVVWFLIVICVVVLVHELGHFWSALLLKIKVETFAIGFGPSIIKKKLKGIEYKLNLLPIGGYVNIKGQESDQKGKDSFSERSVWQRLIVIVAGVVMNFLTASVIFYILLARSSFEYTFDYSILDLGKEPLFGSLEKKSERTLYYSGFVKDDLHFAKNSGMPKYGYVNAINGTRLKDGDDLSNYLSKVSGQEVTLSVMNIETDKEEDYLVKIADDGKLGIYLIDYVSILVDYQGMDKVLAGFEHSINLVQYQGRILGSIVSIAIKNNDPSIVRDIFSGPVAVYQTVDAVSKDSVNVIDDMLLLTALISLNLAIVNILPIPMLDGGYVVFLLLELVRGKKLSKKREGLIITIGIVIMVLLSVLFFVNDILRYTERSDLFEIEQGL